MEQWSKFLSQERFLPKYLDNDDDDENDDDDDDDDDENNDG